MIVLEYGPGIVTMNHLNRRDFTKGLLSSCLASLACGHAMAEEGEHAKELFTEFGVCTSLDINLRII